jgi:hypothetical protein
LSWLHWQHSVRCWHHRSQQNSQNSFCFRPDLSPHFDPLTSGLASLMTSNAMLKFRQNTLTMGLLSVSVIALVNYPHR